jgi:hypothetical protein
LYHSALYRTEIQVLVVCEFKKCYFILMQSTNLDRFQLIPLTLMQIVCWPIERDRKKGEQIIVWVSKERMQGEKGKLCPVYPVSPHATFFLWNTRGTKMRNTYTDVSLNEL